MSQPAGKGAATLTETLVEAHERAQDAVTLSGRRIRNAVATGDLGRIETAASDVVVTLFETADVVLSKVMAVPSEALELPTSLFQSCMDTPNEAVHHDLPSTNALGNSFASVVKLSSTGGATGKAATAPQPGTASASTATAPPAASPAVAGGSEPPTQPSPLKTGLTDGLRTLQQVPAVAAERLNEAVNKIIEADDLSSNQEQARCRLFVEQLPCPEDAWRRSCVDDQSAQRSPIQAARVLAKGRTVGRRQARVHLLPLPRLPLCAELGAVRSAGQVELCMHALTRHKGV